MDVSFTARHCTVPDSVREEALRRFERVGRFGRRAISADLIFEEDHGQKSCEARLHVAGGPPLLATSRAPTFRAALDQTADRVERQLKRLHDRRRRRRGAAARAQRTP